MLKGNERRNTIFECIKNQSAPISGSSLAKQCGVSRQIIVQDIALLRAEGYPIISTSNGYVLNENQSVTKKIRLFYNDNNMEDEMFTVVDHGGKIKEICIQSSVYGVLISNVNINSRVKVIEFINKLHKNNCNSLESIADEAIFQTIEASNYEVLDTIEEVLLHKGYRN